VKVSAILLAAGESTRMGRQKALLPWEGTTLLEYQLAQLAAVDGISEIIVVTGHEPDRIREIVSRSPRAHAVHNSDYRTGKVSSIKAGLMAASPATEALLLLAVDQPRSASVTRAVIEAFAASRPRIAAAAHAGRHGHPLLFARAMLPELLGISEKTKGVRSVMQRNAESILSVEIADPDVHLDLNVPADLERGAR
jgi:molybdenum cofactor cytidylyltransferase